MSHASQNWVGKPVHRKEDPRLLTGKGTYVDDLPISHLCHAAILRSPYPHARIRGIDTSAAEAMPGVVAVLTGEDVKRMARPFPLGVAAPVKYYCMAVDKARFVGEAVALVVARSRYAAEDACDALVVDYEPLPPVVDIEKAMADDAPILHESVGSNVANHRVLNYGDIEQAFAEADLVVREKFVFPKYSSTPMETYAVIAKYQPAENLYTIWSNFQGPFIMHPVVSMTLGVPETNLRFLVPSDVGGGFGIKSSIYPYLTLLALAARKSGETVKWIEDRREHLLASSSGTDRVSYLEAAVKKDGTILGLKTKIMDNVGGYLRTPEPACLYSRTGSSVGAYKFQNLRIDAYAVMTNKCPTGPNRGYGCQQLYFSMERMVDLVARELDMDPAAIRMKNFIQPEDFPYTTPAGGVYDSGDYPAVLRKALDSADYKGLREQQAKARAAGKLFGIGIACAVDPSVTNIAYITVAWTPEERAAKNYHAKSGSGETAVVKIDPLGNVTAIANTVPEGQGHETIIAQIVADELGLTPEDVHVVTEMDTFTRLWSITTGSYSSRFASVGSSAFVMAARNLRRKIIKIGAHLLEVSEDDVYLEEGKVKVRGAPQRSAELRHIAGTAHWNLASLPPGTMPGLLETYVYNFPTAVPPDEKDRIDSQQTYGFIAEVLAVEIDPQTGEIELKTYVSSHDAGNLLNPLIVDGQVWGAQVHGVAGALYEELAYGEDGQMLAATFMDYLCPTAMEQPRVKFEHTETPSPFSVLGSKGLGESSTMVAPATIANAVDDALQPLGISITQLPLPPTRVWELLRRAKSASSA
ncbi:MAG: xanthine dehydrogenase family protein molybdopterin-binding subunit [Candidatus Tectomicrobia bacterium]|nr:xanthine dehydrogenase family protein molybdopterin-binding subunit [Candidatus Tectomicrobia bacterium]